MSVVYTNSRNRNHPLTLQTLSASEAFEFLDPEGCPYTKESIKTSFSGSKGLYGPCLVCHTNSRYLKPVQRLQPHGIYVVSMLTGSIHCRDPRSPVRRIDAKIIILVEGAIDN